MSKSKGNILDPLDLIDGIELDALVAKRTSGLMRPEDAPRIEADTRRQYPDGIPAFGTDALRFTFAVMATQGRDIRFDLGRIGGYRNFCNKLWNAARFVMMAVDQYRGDTPTDQLHLAMPEHWIRGRFDGAIKQVREGFQQYRFDLAAQALYEFAWDEYCDWYIEMAKVRLYDDDTSQAEKDAICSVLLEMLDGMLKALHPLMPFVTEEIWLKAAPLLGTEADTIMRQDFPQVSGQSDPDSNAAFAWVRDFILGVRRVRAEYDIEPAKRLAVLTQGGRETEHRWLNTFRLLIEKIARVESVAPIDDDQVEAATALAGDMTLLVPLSDLIDKDAERERLTRELERLRGEIERAEKKLDNNSFIERAPEAVVTKERTRLADAQSALGKIANQLESL